eukprot:11155092-Lingulodinium_polyedra.AAC.1
MRAGKVKCADIPKVGGWGHLASFGSVFATRASNSCINGNLRASVWGSYLWRDLSRLKFQQSGNVAAPVLSSRVSAMPI